VAIYMAMGSLIAAGVLALLRLKPDQPQSGGLPAVIMSLPGVKQPVCMKS
jgi:hypothetical protein